MAFTTFTGLTRIKSAEVNENFANPISQVVTLDGQASTPSSPSAGFYKAYVKDSTQKLTILDSAGVETTVGSGSSGVNYITATDGTTIGDWTVYDDGASSTPVDGTAGSPGVTYAVSTNSDLRGSSNFLFTHDAADRQGEGFSYAFSIDPSDKGKVLQISLEYLIDSGTYADDDLQFWIYYIDGGNSKLIQPTPFKLKNSGIVEKFAMEFQTEGGTSATTTYRLIGHVATSTATAYTIRFDNWNLGPQAKLYGSPITDWVSYTPTGSWTANSPVYTGQWRRVGDSMELTAKVVCGGAPNSANLTINLPSGYTIDPTKLNTNQPLGTSYTEDSGVLGYDGFVRHNSTNSVQVVSILASGTYGSGIPVTQAAPFTFGANDFVIINAKVPILGWSSSQVMSSDADTRVVAAFGNKAISGSVPSSETVIDFGSTTDTHNAITTGAAWKYTVQAPGKYKITAHTEAVSTAANTLYLKLYKNTTVQNAAGQGVNATTYTMGPTVTAIIDAVAGDYFQVKAIASNTSGTYANDANLSWINIERISGPSQIAASETVAARYMLTSSTGNSSFADVTDEIVDFDTKDFDSHGAVTTGVSWKFTAPISGLYRFNSLITWNATTNLVTTLMKLYKNGAEDRRIGLAKTDDTLGGTTLVRLLAGEYVNIILNQDDSAGAARAIYTGANSGRFSWVEVERVGNF